LGLREFILKTALGGIGRPKAISAFSGRYANVETPHEVPYKVKALFPWGPFLSVDSIFPILLPLFRLLLLAWSPSGMALLRLSLRDPPPSTPSFEHRRLDSRM
jgi:hypothetical protein